MRTTRTTTFSYVSDVRREGVEATPYQGDVRRVVLVGAPNGGIDFSFRHPSANYALLSGGDNHKLNAPVSWERAILYGLPQNVSEQGFSSKGPDYFPGQRQLLADLSGDHPLSPLEPDWYTTYHGGQGFVSYSKGIRHYIEEGENVIARLKDHPIPEEIEVAVVAGNAANIPGIVNEYTGPSDGLLFVSSALDLPEETNIIARDVLPLHHKALVSDPKGQQWIADALNKESCEVKDLEAMLHQSEMEWKARQDDKKVGETLSAVAVGAADRSSALPLILPMV